MGRELAAAPPRTPISCPLDRIGSQITSWQVDKQHSVNVLLATFVGGITLFLAIPARSDDAKPPPSSSAQDLTALSLEQLFDIRVQSAALHPQSLEDAPASVTVLT